MQSSQRSCATPNRNSEPGNNTIAYRGMENVVYHFIKLFILRTSQGLDKSSVCMALKIPKDPLMMLELAVMSVRDGISLILTQSQKTVPAYISPSVIWFCSSRPASECITSVPRMGRVPSSGWTGSRAASQMPEAHVRQAREELTDLPDRVMTVIPGPEVLLTLSPLEAISMSHRSG